MRKLELKSRKDVIGLLLSGSILAVKDHRYSSYGGFQRWHYDKITDICSSCESHWSDRTKRIQTHSLKKAAKILWRNRKSLYIYTADIPKDMLENIQVYFEHA